MKAVAQVLSKSGIVRSGIAFGRLAPLMALGVYQLGVFYGVAVRSVFAIKFGIFQRKLVTAMKTFTILQPPLQHLEFGTSASARSGLAGGRAVR